MGKPRQKHLQLIRQDKTGYPNTKSSAEIYMDLFVVIYKGNDVTF